MLAIALPFTSLRLNAPRPHALPRGYPTSLVTLVDDIRRRRLGLTQTVLAALFGLGAGTVADLEAGRRCSSARGKNTVAGLLEHAKADSGRPKIPAEK